MKIENLDNARVLGSKRDTLLSMLRHLSKDNNERCVRIQAHYEPSEQPKVGKAFLAIMANNMALVLVLINEVDYPCYGLKKWAYIEDLYKSFGHE